MHCKFCNSMYATPIGEFGNEFNFWSNQCGEGSYEPFDGGKYPWCYTKEDWKEFRKELGELFSNKGILDGYKRSTQISWR